MAPTQDALGERRLLLVDDTPENLDVLGEALDGYRRSFARDGERALKMLRDGLRPDLILLDVMMPDLDGFEVCRQMKADPALADIPVIFVTAMGEADDETRGFSLGAVDYITKPINPEVVRARVRTHLELKVAKERLAQQNVELEQQVSERTTQLSEALDRLRGASLETILRLSMAAEYKDEDTGAHVLRISHLTSAIADHMGCSRREVEQLRHAAPLHDIGKIGIPDRILLKPGKLNDEEWVVMRQHTSIGAQILAGSDAEVIQLGELIALTHHERWDGSGYPRGLSGQDIPLQGRILAVADVFDALTSKRPYKEPFSLDKSFAIVRESAGSHFDPAVVEAFFDIELQVRRIKEQYQDDQRSPFLVMAGTG